MFKKFLLDNGLSTEKGKFEIYIQAFTHPTFANEHKNSSDYQRLEFLGDSILSLFLAEEIFKKHSNLAEGKMSIMKAHLESKPSLAKIGKELKLEEFILFGNTKEGVSNNDNIISDIFESFLAAIYINDGREKAFEFFQKVFKSKIEKFDEDAYKSPKTVLQEFLQTDSRATSPNYNTWEQLEDGRFKVCVSHMGNVYGCGIGKNKKEAEVEAAKNALTKVKGAQ